MNVRGRVTPKVYLKNNGPKHGCSRRWEVSKLAVLFTVLHVAQCIREENRYHASHGCGSGDVCIDNHCDIESSDDNFDREDCFQIAQRGYRAGLSIPEFRENPSHASSPCHLWLKVKASEYPQSMLIKEKTMVLRKKPEQLTEEDVGPLFLQMTHGFPSATSQLYPDDFNYVVWDHASRTHQRAKVRRIPLAAAQLQESLASLVLPSAYRLVPLPEAFQSMFYVRLAPAPVVLEAIGLLESLFYSSALFSEPFYLLQ